MAHQRQEIREAVAAQLTGTDPDFATGADDRVRESRMIPWPRIQLPAIAVYTLEETVEPVETASREINRKLSLAIEIAAEASDDVDDTLDTLCAEVEAAMALDETFDGKAAASILASTDIDLLEVGQKMVGLARLVYTVTYQTDAAVVDADLDNFDTADIVHNLGNEVLEADQAEDLVEDIYEE